MHNNFFGNLFLSYKLFVTPLLKENILISKQIFANIKGIFSMKFLNFYFFNLKLINKNIFINKNIKLKITGRRFLQKNLVLQPYNIVKTVNYLKYFSKIRSNRSLKKIFFNKLSKRTIKAFSSNFELKNEAVDFAKRKLFSSFRKQKKLFFSLFKRS